MRINNFLKSWRKSGKTSELGKLSMGRKNNAKKLEHFWLIQSNFHTVTFKIVRKFAILGGTRQETQLSWGKVLEMSMQGSRTSFNSKKSHHSHGPTSNSALSIRFSIWRIFFFSLFSSFEIPQWNFANSFLGGFSQKHFFFSYHFHPFHFFFLSSSLANPEE